MAALNHSTANALIDALPSNTSLSPAHSAFRLQVRSFVHEYLTDDVIQQCERTGGVPRELIKKSYEAGIYAMRAPVELGGTPPKDLSAGKSVDAFFEYILIDELSGCGAHGMVVELIGNFGMLLPLLDAFASEEIRRTIVQPMIRADMFGCFAFTEPIVQTKLDDAGPTKPKLNKQATTPTTGSNATQLKRPGSGRPSMRTTATRQSDGSFLLSGEKMFISFAERSDYVITACTIQDSSVNTGSDRRSLLSLLLVPSKLSGVRITPMSLHGWRSTSTCRISFDRVRVPADLLLVDGATSSVPVMGMLFQLLRSNIHQERYVTSIMAHRSARICLEESIEFARRKRVDPDHRLADSSVVRHQIVQMAVAVQQTRLQLEELTAHLSNADKSTSSTDGTVRWTKPLGQQTALIKFACTAALNKCVQFASAILGASALAAGGGPGGRIERIRRDAAVSATTGGNENILLEFVAKQAKL